MSSEEKLPTRLQRVTVLLGEEFPGMSPETCEEIAESIVDLVDTHNNLDRMSDALDKAFRRAGPPTPHPDRPCTGPGKCKPGAKCEKPCEECHTLGHTHTDQPKPRQSSSRPTPTSRGHILKEAHALINGERQDSYGKPEDSFGLIASFWSMYLSNRRKASFVSKLVPGHFVNISPADVCIMMALLKLARHANNPDHRDNLADAAGYIGLASDL